MTNPTTTIPTTLILHMQDMADGLVGPFNNYQEVEDHIKQLKELGAGCEVQAIYPTESLLLKYFIESTTHNGKFPPMKIQTPQEDIAFLKSLL